MQQIARRDRPSLPWLPFARLNLLRNPFGELSPDDRIRAAVLDVEPWATWLHQPDSAIQFVGPCGRGKTTHLFAICACFPAAAYVYLPEDDPHPKIPWGTPLLIDEAQRMSIWERRQVLRRRVPLALGTHRDLSRSLQRAGYRVRTIDVAAETNAARLQAIGNRRVELARLGRGPIPHLTKGDAQALDRRFGTDVRAMEHYLYDQFQHLAQGDGGGKLRIDD